MISPVVGIAFCLLAVFHTRVLKEKGLAPMQGHFLVKFAGPSIDPLIEAVGFAFSFHTSAALLGDLFLDLEVVKVGWPERIVFGLVLGLLMFWSLQRPARQFMETFWAANAAMATAGNPPKTP